MKKSVKKQTQLSFQLGGVVQQPGTGIGGYVAPTVPTTGFTPLGTAVAPVTPGSLQPQQAATPIVNYNQGNLPTFGNVVGTGGGAYDEIVTYVNAAGQIQQIPHVNGKPIYPVPQGYTKQASPTDVTPDSPLVNTTTQVRDDDRGGDNDDDISSTSGSGRLPSVLSLGNLFSNKTSKTGVKGESIFGSGIGVADKYDASRPGLSGLNALSSVNPNTDLKNNIGDIGNALGIYGTDGINLGSVFSVATGNILGAAVGASGLGPNTNIGYKEAPAGFGVFSTDQLSDYVSGKMSPIEMKAISIDQMSQQQAVQRAQVQRQIGTTLTGRYGFSKGSIDPNTGLVYDVTGRAVNYGGNTEGVNNSSFSSGKDWVGAVDASLETGYWGGPVSVDAFNKLSSTGQAKYNSKMALLGHDEAEGGVGGSSPNKGTDTTFKGGDNPAGGQSSSLGRQDYTGGISQDNSSDNEQTSNDTSGRTEIGGYDDYGGNEPGQATDE